MTSGRPRRRRDRCGAPRRAATHTVGARGIDVLAVPVVRIPVVAVRAWRLDEPVEARTEHHDGDDAGDRHDDRATPWRTGTACGPRPGSNAIEAPTPTGGASVAVMLRPLELRDAARPDAAALLTHRPPAGERADEQRDRPRSRRHRRRRRRRRTPRPDRARLARASPIGMSGDASVAPTTARAAPRPRSRRREATIASTRCGWDRPSPRSAGEVGHARSTRRRSATATTTSPVSAAITANASNPADTTSIDCWIAPSVSPAGWTWNSPTASPSLARLAPRG